jgi:hypothetical protein
MDDDVLVPKISTTLSDTDEGYVVVIKIVVCVDIECKQAEITNPSSVKQSQHRTTETNMNYVSKYISTELRNRGFAARRNSI